MSTMRAVAYCRVSSEEQVKGFSLDDQEETLRHWCQQNGHELLELVKDEGHSGAYLERPGLDRVRDLVEVGGVALVIAQGADRITRDPGHRMLLDEEFDKRGCRLKALDDWGDDSHEGQLLKFMKGWMSKGERLKIAERTRRGRRQKSKQGLLVAPSTIPYGFRLAEGRSAYLVDEEQMAVVRRIFQMFADGAGPFSVKRTLEAEGIPTPGGGKLWSRSTLRDFIKKDTYFPFTLPELRGLGLRQLVRDTLNPEGTYGVVWAGRHDWKVLGRKRRPDGSYRDVRRHTEKPREEWIALPVPTSGVPREVAERARRNVELRLPVPKAGRRVWELSGGFARCAECGRALFGRQVAPKGRRVYHYYICSRKAEEKSRSGCPNRNHRAEPLEERVREYALRLIHNPDTLREQVEIQVKAERESKPWLRDAREAASARERLAKLDLVADRYRDQMAEGLIPMARLREKLDALAEEREDLERRLALLADGERRLRELETLPDLLEEYLRDLPELLEGYAPPVREYETVPAERTADNPYGVYLATPESIRFLSDEEAADKRRAAEADRGARFRGFYARLGLRAAVHADGTLEITVGATGKATKGIMPCDISS